MHFHRPLVKYEGNASITVVHLKLHVNSMNNRKAIITRAKLNRNGSSKL